MLKDTKIGIFLHIRARLRGTCDPAGGSA